MQVIHVHSRTQPQKRRINDEATWGPQQMWYTLHPWVLQGALTSYTHREGHQDIMAPRSREHRQIGASSLCSGTWPCPQPDAAKYWTGLQPNRWGIAVTSSRRWSNSCKWMKPSLSKLWNTKNLRLKTPITVGIKVFSRILSTATYRKDSARTWYAAGRFSSCSSFKEVRNVSANDNEAPDFSTGRRQFCLDWEPTSPQKIAFGKNQSWCSTRQVRNLNSVPYRVSVWNVQSYLCITSSDVRTPSRPNLMTDWMDNLYTRDECTRGRRLNWHASLLRQLSEKKVRRAKAAN